MLYRMYTRWAERHGFTYKIMDYQDGDTAVSSPPIFSLRAKTLGFPQG